VKGLLERLKGPVTAPEQTQVLRAIEVLERTGTPKARGVLAALSRGAPDALLTREAKASLDRLNRRKAASSRPARR
jgi:hypothetical protein